MLVFEDLHWADDALLDFVDHLVDWAGGVPLLVVCTARPELLERRPGWGGGKRNALDDLALAARRRRHRAAGRRAARAGRAPRRDAGGAARARAAGNPLYAEEYVRMLIDRGLLHRDGDGGARRRDDLPVPETVQG